MRLHVRAMACAPLQGLKRVAHTGVTVTAVIHQPSYETFCLFDDLVLLAKGGLTAFVGPQRDVQVSVTAGCCINKCLVTHHCCSHSSTFSIPLGCLGRHVP
jgi:hypothetical protein